MVTTQERGILGGGVLKSEGHSLSLSDLGQLEFSWVSPQGAQHKTLAQEDWGGLGEPRAIPFFRAVCIIELPLGTE